MDAKISPRKYNRCLMMDNQTYEKSEGLDLSQISSTKIKDLYENCDLVWVTRISLQVDNGIMPSGEKYLQKKVVNDNIVPCIVTKFNGQYYLIGVNEEKINALRIIYKDLVFEYQFVNIPIRFALCGYIIPDEYHVCASQDYSYVNRYRHEMEVKLRPQQCTVWEKPTLPNKSTFSIEEAKKALSKVHGIPVEEIEIKL